MMELLLTKTVQGYLVPSGEDDGEKMRRFKVGSIVRVVASTMRNYRFHKKYFALLRIGFDAWEPPAGQFRGETAQKNFERFREDCIILAGYYDVTVNLSGETRLKAKSISFASMEEEEFEKLYSKTIDVILQRILVGQSREDLDRAVEQVLGFA